MKEYSYKFQYYYDENLIDDVIRDKKNSEQAKQLLDLFETKVTEDFEKYNENSNIMFSRIKLNNEEAIEVTIKSSLNKQIIMKMLEIRLIQFELIKK